MFVGIPDAPSPPPFCLLGFGPQACQAGRIKVMDALYQRVQRRSQRKALLDEPPRGGQPPLMGAVAAGSEEAVRWLLAKGAAADALDWRGRTAAMEAAANRQWEILTVRPSSACILWSRVWSGRGVNCSCGWCCCVLRNGYGIEC